MKRVHGHNMEIFCHFNRSLSIPILAASGKVIIAWIETSLAMKFEVSSSITTVVRSRCQQRMMIDMETNELNTLYCIIILMIVN